MACISTLGAQAPARRVVCNARGASPGPQSAWRFAATCGGGVGSSTTTSCSSSFFRQRVQPTTCAQQPELYSCSRNQAASSQAAAADDSSAAAASAVQSQSREQQARQHPVAAAVAFLDALYRFSRPHTMLGTLISICSVSALAAGAADGALGSPAAAKALSQALSSALLMNVCIVGINQLYDVEIDKTNKPYLPLAAGDFSMTTGVVIVVLTGAASLFIAWASGSMALLATVSGSLLLGLVYSCDLPLLRWKRSPVLAAACILAVRALLVQIGFFLHMKRALVPGAGLVLARPIVFATAFMLLFSVVIAMFKDIPDVAGDSRAGVHTLSVRLGPRRVFWTCIALLELGYIGAVVAAVGSSHFLSQVAGVVAHATLALVLLWRARQTDISSSKSVYRCYIFTWILFYLEYMLLPLFA